ncbi:hypothetical protein [Mycobacterium sp. 48b]|uniref:hypothetical protein n=1 Tax=Mycobacterium sp. 48b TaxID=3400426 RepID=UPI003AB0502F
MTAVGVNYVDMFGNYTLPAWTFAVQIIEPVPAVESAVLFTGPVGQRSWLAVCSGQGAIASSEGLFFASSAAARHPPTWWAGIPECSNSRLLHHLDELPVDLPKCQISKDIGPI